MPAARRPDLCAGCTTAASTRSSSSGLHEFLSSFIASNSALGVQLQDDFLMIPRPCDGGGGVNAMLICVEHATSYAYSEPLLSSTQYLRMTPLSGSTQAVESWKLTCPGAATTPWQDQYGNLCHTLDRGAAGRASWRSRYAGWCAPATPTAWSGPRPPSCPPPSISARRPIPSPRRRSATSPPGSRPKLKRDAIETLHEIMMTIADEVEYRKGETHVHTTGAEALEQGAACARTTRIFSAPRRGCSACRRAMSAAI